MLPTAIPRKGQVLTQLSLFWFDRLVACRPNHLLAPTRDFPAGLRRPRRDARSPAAPCSSARREVVPFECVVRGYLAGSRLEGVPARPAPSAASRCRRGCARPSELPEPIFTPATKAESGHDENIPFERAWRRASAPSSADELRDLQPRRLPPGRRVRRGARHHPRRHEVRVGPTADGELILIDEVLTPDSSRFWPADRTGPGEPRRRSTSSSSATGWRRPAGTSARRRRGCRPRLSRRRAPSTWKPIRLLTGHELEDVIK